jgi:hypothetical protein
LTEVLKTGDNSGSVDRLRRLETSENSACIEEVPLESSKPDTVEGKSSHVENILRKILPVPDASK